MEPLPIIATFRVCLGEGIRPTILRGHYRLHQKQNAPPAADDATDGAPSAVNLFCGANHHQLFQTISAFLAYMCSFFSMRAESPKGTTYAGVATSHSGLTP